jgi:hypothetical protein
MVFGSFQMALGPDKAMFKAVWSRPISIFTVPDFGNGDSGSPPFGLPGPSKKSLLSVASGADVNCDELRIIPHAHCTHLESGMHIASSFKFSPLPVSINAPKLAIVLDANDLDGPKDDEIEVVFIRKPVSISASAPVPAPAPASIRDPIGLRHELASIIDKRFPTALVVGINEASFDAEDDCKLPFHRHWFAAASNHFLLELADLSDCNLQHNGRYLCLLNVQLLRGTDAFPACPILYPIEAVD